MAAGAMDRRISFQRFALVDDGFSKVEAWAAHGSPVWASRADVSDGEKSRAGEMQSVLMARFSVRYSAFTAGLTPKDRLICEGVVFDIEGIKEQGQRRTALEITAAARSDQ